MVRALQRGMWTQQELHEQCGFTLAVAPLALGLVAVTLNRGGSYERYYCAPGSARCSCGSDMGNCVHLAAAELHSVPAAQPVYPVPRRRGRRGATRPSPPSL